MEIMESKILLIIVKTFSRLHICIFRYHRVRTPSWAVGGETSMGEDGSRTTSRQQLRSVESVPCRVDGGERHGSSALRVSRRSISRDSRDNDFMGRTVSFTAAVAAAAEAASSTSGSSNFSPATVQEYYPVGVPAMAHNRGTFSSVGEPFSCVDVVDLSEEFLMSTGEVKTHARTRSSTDEYFAAVSEVNFFVFSF